MRETSDHVKYLRKLAERLQNNSDINEQLHLVADHLEELAAAIVMNNRLIAMTEQKVTQEEVKEIWKELKQIRKLMVTQTDLEMAMMESSGHYRG